MLKKIIKMLFKNFLSLFKIKINLYRNRVKINFSKFEILFYNNVESFQFINLYPKKRPLEATYLNIGGGIFIIHFGII